MTVTDVERAHELLAELVYSMNDITGALVASLDGRPLAAELPSDIGERQTAAFVASAIGLGGRIVELTGSASVDELMVTSDSGTVVIYGMERLGALLLLCRPTINLALLNRRARTAASELAEVLGAAASTSP